MTFAMIKYQEDLDIIKPTEKTLEEKNEVYSAIKASLGNFVCDTGIKESRVLRNKVYGGFGRSANPYNVLCDEIVKKISTSRSNIFSYWDRSKSRKLHESLLKISEKSLRDKTPEIKIPIYANGD
jgi:hypothetical protein